MIPELGQFALALALAVALIQGILPLAGAAKGNLAWMALARPAAQAQAVLIAAAFGCLVYSFVSNDFSVQYVAMNSNSALPLHYRIAGAWGGHEGSLLLWCLMLGVWTTAVTLFSAHLPEEMTARVLGVMGLVSAGFIAFMLFTSNPFDRLFPAAQDGRDLNPLLQDPGMVIHPPMLYMGYVGFSVAFAFAVSALLSGRLDAAWARWSRPWTTVAWAFLTCGIALGSGWAYYELGWGGWWFWDPVENASFMPWLVGTALIHSLAVTEKRGAFRSWTVLLAIIAFGLSLLGTFLVRSGVLTSVHAFATDPRRGIFILGLFAFMIGGALALYAWRTARIGLGGEFAPVSRESLLLGNNVFLAAAAGTVFLGTLYPLLIDALGVGKISVGPQYFEAVFVPLMAPALFLMGVGPLARWKRASLPELAVLLRWALGISLALGVLLPFLFGEWHALVGFGLALAAWIVISGFLTLKKRPRDSRAYWGMLIAHCGVAVFVVGVTLVKGYESDRDVKMRPGDTVELAGYVFRLESVSPVRGPNYTAAQARIDVTRNGKPVTTMYPERRMYPVAEQVMTEAAIHPGLTRDLYVSLGDALEEPGGKQAGKQGAWLVKVQHKPFVDWIWAGCLIMAIGGVCAASDRRYRFSVQRARTAEVAAYDPRVGA
ncbi:MAG TPA: heme lyase CcmF/NrfE family subunit [Burkholderiales bacterium]|jgi:cytochrome c-type biogenesis protein CcmF|nr:heme lyase CcmF/NrfE family subunit [Burkholderiales bacterium]